MSPSTAPAAKTAILELLQARPALSDVTVRRSAPRSEEDAAHQIVYFGRTQHTEEQRGFGTWTEDYILTLVIRVFEYGDDEQSTEDRWWAIRADISAAIRADPRLGGALNENGADIGDTEVDESEAFQDGWLVVGRVDVPCTAVLI